MRYLTEISQLYSDMFLEDVQSSLNQAKNILSNNGIENVEGVLTGLEQIYSQAEVEDEHHKVANKDTNIPALAFWFIADPQIMRIREDYRQYINTRSLYQKNFLINSVEQLKKDITAKKLFKPSEEKTKLIKDAFTKITQTIHGSYTPPPKKEDVREIANRGELGQPDQNTVYEDDNIIVYKADSKEKCIYYGTDSSLCISTKGGGNYYWAYRMGEQRDDDLGMTTYFVFWKNEKYADGKLKRILVDALGDEDGPANEYSWNPMFKKDGRYNNDDDDITPEQLIQKFPELEEPFQQHIFQFVPYGGKEKRFAWIDENVSNLTTWGAYEDYYSKLEGSKGSSPALSDKIVPQLQTLEDIEMFLESDKIVRIKEWEILEREYPQHVKYLFKKYAGITDTELPYELIKRYLSPKDMDWYEDTVLPKLGEYSSYNYYEYIPQDLIDDRIARKILGDSKVFDHYIRFNLILPKRMTDLMTDAQLNRYFFFINYQRLLSFGPGRPYDNLMEKMPYLRDRVLSDTGLAFKLILHTLPHPTPPYISKYIPKEIIDLISSSPVYSYEFFLSVGDALDFPQQILDSIKRDDLYNKKYLRAIGVSTESFNGLYNRLQTIILK